MLNNFIDLKLALVEWVGILAEFSEEKKKDRVFFATDELPLYDRIPKPFLQVDIIEPDELSVSHEILEQEVGDKILVRMPYRATVRITTHGSLLTEEGIYVTAQDLIEKIRFNYADEGEILDLSRFYDKHLGHIFFLGGMSKSENISYFANDQRFVRFFADIQIEYWITKEKYVDKLLKIPQSIIKYNS